jgi:hypothetical protein
VDDNFDKCDPKERPHPTSTTGRNEGKPLYVEVPCKDPNSLIRQDDVESYIRTTTYQNKLFRGSMKFVNNIKWMPYLKRFEIWRSSREMVLELKNEYNKNKNRLLNTISDKIRFKLLRAGIKDEKLLTTIIDKYTSHLKIEEFNSKSEAL